MTDDMKTRLIPLIAAAMFILAACAQETQPDVRMPENLGATLESPVCGDSFRTKALSDQFQFSFVQGDQVNVFLKSGSDEAMTYLLTPYSSNQLMAKFNVRSFMLLNDTYVSIYPSQYFILGSENIRLTFAGQVQSENGSTAHLSPYDYCWAETTIANNSGNFAFKHKVSWIKILVPVTEAVTFKTVSITSDEGVANNATINIKNGTLSTSRSSGEALDITLGGTQGITVAENDTLTVFTTIPSELYTNITVVASDASGRTWSYSRENPVTLEAGKYYTMTLTADTSSQDGGNEILSIIDGNHTDD